jgi:hypothetical protein
MLRNEASLTYIHISTSKKRNIERKERLKNQQKHKEKKDSTLILNPANGVKSNTQKRIEKALSFDLQISKYHGVHT